MKRLFPTLHVLLIAAPMVCLQCSMADLTGGGTIETTNGAVTGTVILPSGDPAPGTTVKLLPVGYDPVKDTTHISTVTTDALGNFAFPHVSSGDYTTQMTHPNSGANAFIDGIHVAKDTVTAPIAVLYVPGSIKVSLPSGINRTTGYLYIPGTTLFAFINNNTDFVVLDSVPSGIIHEIDYSLTNSIAVTTIRYNVPVAAGDTVVVWNPSWKYAHMLILNTSVTGANVAGNVVNFPVLIKLNAGNFDFSHARADGADIRFTKSDNMPLPYEIDQWDPVNGDAEIWVRVDTVYGHDSTQSITMYWGNPDAADLSNSTAVFDTAGGFQGTWHFSDDVNDPVRDATANGYHGLSPDTARPRVAEGMVGTCRVFDGADDYITMPYTSGSRLNFPVNGHYTVSAWVKIDSLDGASHLIVAKGYEQYFLRFTYFPSNSPLWEFSEFGATDSWNACTTPAKNDQWVLLTGVRQGNRQSLYCNGVLVDSIPNIYPTNNFSRNTSNDLSVGKFLQAVDVPNFDDSYCFFKGSIDEVRIMSAAQSPDWVWLCYMNQRADDRLVVFKRQPAKGGYRN